VISVVEHLCFVVVPVPVPTLEKFWFWFRVRLPQFSKNKTIAQNLPFSVSEAAYFSESWPFIFDFLTLLLHIMLDPDPNPVLEPDPE
jgi:hypothetical protein